MPSRILFCSLMVALAALLMPHRLIGSEELAASEGDLECAVCHENVETELLTDQGRYFQMMRTLEEYEEVLERFGKCTYCHVKDAGSLAMTEQGNRFKWMMDDMQGLRSWMAEQHPKSDDDETEDED